MSRTAFFHDERCLWHGGGHYSLTLPVGGPWGNLVQPGGGLPESPESKRRMVNLMQVTGLMGMLDLASAPPADRAALGRVHPAAYLDRFAQMSAQGGELGPRSPFLPGGYEVAALSAGLSIAAMRAVLTGKAANAYALSRPPGHHCLPGQPNGFCLLANIAVAIRAMQAEGRVRRVAVLDWDVHHGNGTEAIFLDDPDVLTISLHQDRNYPADTGGAEVRGAANSNVNVPLPPGCGTHAYLAALDRIALPAITAHAPDLIVVACGYDAGAMDPLGRMLLGADDFGAMTDRVMGAAASLCGGRLMMAHEGGYSETHVPFCGHAVLARMAGSAIAAPDPLGDTIRARQPAPRWNDALDGYIDDLALTLGIAA